MKYLMFVATDAQPDPEPEDPHEIGAWFDTVNAGGNWVTGDRLRPQSEAKTVRVRSGKLQVTDGPYAETKEAIVGFDILECASLDDAIELASQHPMARAGRIEIRQFWPLEDS